MVTGTVEIVLDSQIEEETNMGVGHPVEDLPPLLAGTNESGQTELAELVAGRRLTRSNQTGEIADANLSRIHQGIDHPQPVGIGQQLEALGQQGGVVGVEQPGRRRAVVVGVGD